MPAVGGVGAVEAHVPGPVLGHVEDLDLLPGPVEDVDASAGQVAGAFLVESHAVGTQRAVREGQDILVTDRGEVIAELRRPGPPADVAYPALVEALRRGRARLGSANRPDVYPALDPALPAGAARRMLDDDRDDR